MKSALALVALLAVVALVPSPPVSADAPGSVADALVRVAHFSPDTAGVDVWVDGKRVLQNVGYDTVSDYVALPSGDHEFALRRMESSGVILTTTETAMFEWCRTADRPEFKKISALAKESPP